MDTKIVIIGAGITGLSLAHFLKKSGIDFILLEKESETGGKIKTLIKDDFTLECGPNTVLLKEPALKEVLFDLNLLKSIIFASKSIGKNRFVNTENGIFKIPSGPFSFFSSQLITFYDKWQIIKDVFSKTSYSNESITVEDYFNKKFSKNVTRNFIDPFVTGIYAGDISKMSFKYSFPALFKADNEKGSLIKGLTSERGNNSKNEGIFSFEGGLNRLVQSISSQIDHSLILNAEVQSIKKQNSGNFHIKISSKHTTRTITSNYIVDTRALKETAKSFNLNESFPEIEYVPVVSLHLGYKTSETVKVPKGFGLLNNKMADKKYLGCIFNSDIFPHTAPKGFRLFTLLIGGARNPNYALNFDRKIRDEVIEDFNSTFRINARPDFIHHFSWPAAIPQYNSGYERVVKNIKKFHKANKNYFLLGNYYEGVSIGDCMKKSKKLSEFLIDQD
ncbi:protoporphyrinogen oxidase [Hyphobacterium sp. CCMP332]|nr:protoporphyrinogen oxidase [Hyphobacterium sp. CCMP332]